MLFIIPDFMLQSHSCWYQEQSQNRVRRCDERADALLSRRGEGAFLHRQLTSDRTQCLPAGSPVSSVCANDSSRGLYSTVAQFLSSEQGTHPVCLSELCGLVRLSSESCFLSFQVKRVAPKSSGYCEEGMLSLMLTA